MFIKVYLLTSVFTTLKTTSLLSTHITVILVFIDIHGFRQNRNCGIFHHNLWNGARDCQAWPGIYYGQRYCQVWPEVIFKYGQRYCQVWPEVILSMASGIVSYVQML